MTQNADAFDAAQRIRELFRGFDKPTKLSVANPLSLVVFFLVGGWVLVLFNVILVVPSLVIVWIVRRLYIKPLPQVQLHRKCDLCERDAVGYKNIRGLWAFLHVIRRAELWGFLCHEHTTEFVGRASKMNLMGVFGYVGGFCFVNNFFRTRFQANNNIRVFPRSCGDPERDPAIEIAKTFYNKAKGRCAGISVSAKTKKTWLDCADSFFLRAYMDATSDSLRAEALIHRTLALLQCERVADGEENWYLTEAHYTIEEVFRLLPSAQLPPELTALAADARSEIDKRSRKKSPHGRPIGAIPATCPHCQAQYFPADYNQNADVWFCSSCKNPLPREAKS